MVITWDDKKNAENLETHGVDFEEASTVVLNPLSLFGANENEYDDPNRFEYLGHSEKNRVVYVVTVEKHDDEIRIIHAREAKAHEIEEYENGL
jgi:uncharacterized DUF497 family protein